MARVKPIQTEAWFRKLADEGTIEIFLKAGDRKIRARGPEAEMYELVEWFEEKTGLRINGDWRRPPRSGPRPIEGQLDITELESGDEPPDEPDAAPLGASELVDPEASPFAMPKGEA